MGTEGTAVPWKDTSPMTERQRVIDEYLRGESSVAERCRRVGISRKTGHTWRRRYLEGGELTDRSRRPHTSPRALSAWLEDAIVEARRQRPRWGPTKVRAARLRVTPGAERPAVSPVALICRRNGLGRPRRRRPRTPPCSAPFGAVQAPTALGGVDCTGQVSVGRPRGSPLTVRDAYSRSLVACGALRRPDGEAGRRAFEPIVLTFGLPEALRADNGPPFATASPGGRSRRSAGWLTLGIRHERLAPGHPEPNGRCERMPLTLKPATAMPPAATLYAPSPRPRPHPSWGRDLASPPEFETRRVRKDGRVAWTGRSVLADGLARGHGRHGPGTSLTVVTWAREGGLVPWTAMSASGAPARSVRGGTGATTGEGVQAHPPP